MFELWILTTDLHQETNESRTNNDSSWFTIIILLHRRSQTVEGLGGVY